MLDFTEQLLASHQERLADLGYYKLRIDGVDGPGTQNAFTRFKEAEGLRARPFPGPVTCEAIWDHEAMPAPKLAVVGDEPPWMAEARSLLGTREVRGSGNNPKIMQWAKDLDQWYPGDDIAWCGLFVAHCMSVADDPQDFNRLGAREWLKYGVEYPEDGDLPLGGVAVFWRTSPTHWHGHVALISGFNATHVRVIGGNQSDNVTEAWFPRSRLLGVRLPRGAAAMPALTATTGNISTNEA